MPRESGQSVSLGVMVGLVESRDYVKEGALLEEVWVLGQTDPVTQVIVYNNKFFAAVTIYLLYGSHIILRVFSFNCRTKLSTFSRG